MNAPKLDLVHLAIRSGVLGHIRWKHSTERQVRDNPSLRRLTPDSLRRMLRQHVLEGKVLDARPEAREEFLAENPDHPYWYRAILAVDGFPNGIFVEVKLVDEDPEEPWVEIVSAHRQES